MHWAKIDGNLVNKFLDWQHKQGVDLVWIYPTQTLTGYENTGELSFKLRIPFFAEYDPGKKAISEKPIFNHLVVIIKAGTGAVGFFENSKISLHKGFNAYMVRKKQGKSQIKHLKTKGKSRAGSRVRLQHTRLFFDRISQKINQIANQYALEHISISCSKTLWPYFFAATPALPFGKRDSRIQRIPIHLPNTTHRVLLKTHEHLSSYRMLARPEIWQAWSERNSENLNEMDAADEDW